MKVECSKCESKYNIKDIKIPDAGAKIKCPKCQNVISVMKPAPEPPAAPLVDWSVRRPCELSSSQLSLT